MDDGDKLVSGADVVGLVLLVSDPMIVVVSDTMTVVVGSGGGLVDSLETDGDVFVTGTEVIGLVLVVSGPMVVVAGSGGELVTGVVLSPVTGGGRKELESAAPVVS